MKSRSFKAAIPLTFCLFAALPAQANITTYYNCAALSDNGSCSAIHNLELITTTYDKTTYPVLLAHGLGGWSSMANVFDHYYGIPKELARNGAQVYETMVTQFNTTDIRGEELRSQIEQILAITGEDKVNLIGHSHGAASTRYAMNTIPSKVASVTIVGGVNRGSKTADAVVALEDDPATNLISQAFYQVLNGLGPLFSFLSGNLILDHDAESQVHELTSEGLTQFNARFPAGIPVVECDKSVTPVKWQGISLYSFTGTKPITMVLDPVDWVIALTKIPFGSEPNDGLVGQCSTHFGQVIRDDYDMNHGDEINQFLGMVDLFETNPVSVYRAHVNRIKNDGN